MTKLQRLQSYKNFPTSLKKAGDNDRVLIFFAGHGETIDLPDGGEMGFLLPVDGNNIDLYISAIEMDELKTLSLLSKAKHILYLIDACYGGIASVGARGLDAKSTSNYLQKITQYKARQIISAGGRGEQVIEKPEWGHSAFTKNLLSGLGDSKADTDSDGIITVQELGTYLKKKVTIDSNNQQTPKTRNLSTDEGEFVFILDEITTKSHQSSDVPISDNGDEYKFDSNQRSQFVRTANFFIGEYNIGNKYENLPNLIGVEIGLNLDKGITEIGLNIFISNNSNYSLKTINSYGLYYRKYFIPYGTFFINSGMDFNVMHVEREDGDLHGIGFNPNLGFGFIFSEIFSKRIMTNFKFGYLFILDSDMTDIANEKIPHGFNFNVTFGLYNRFYSKQAVIMPE